MTDKVLFFRCFKQHCVSTLYLWSTLLCFVVYPTISEVNSPGTFTSIKLSVIPPDIGVYMGKRSKSDRKVVVLKIESKSASHPEDCWPNLETGCRSGSAD